MVWNFSPTSLSSCIFVFSLTPFKSISVHREPIIMEGLDLKSHERLLAGVCKLSASLGHTGRRRAVLGHTLNTL